MSEARKGKRELEPRRHTVRNHGGLTGTSARAWSYGNPKSRNVYVELRDSGGFMLGLLSFRVPR